MFHLYLVAEHEFLFLVFTSEIEYKVTCSTFFSEMSLTQTVGQCHLLFAVAVYSMKRVAVVPLLQHLLLFSPWVLLLAT